MFSKAAHIGRGQKMIVFLCLAITAVLVIILIKGRKRDIPSDDIPKNNRPPAKGILNFILVSSVFWIIGIPMIAGSFLLKAKEEWYVTNGKPVDAVISDIVDYEIGDSDGNYYDARDVYLHYTVNEAEYDNVLENAGLYGIAVGETLEIYCRANDPADFICLENIEAKISFTFPVGIILTVLPFGVCLAGKITQKDKD